MHPLPGLHLLPVLETVAVSVGAVKAIQTPLVEARGEVEEWAALAVRAGNPAIVGKLGRIHRLIEAAVIACQDAVDEAGTLSELETARD